MRIEVLFIDGCPHVALAQERLRTAIDRLGLDDVAITTVEVRDEDEAVEVGFTGSPTIRVDGHDPFAAGREVVALACRVYSTPDGPSGAPSVQQLMDALS